MTYHPEWATADMFRVGETWKTKLSTQTWLITEITPEGKVWGVCGKSVRLGIHRITATICGLNLDRSDWMIVSVGDTPKITKPQAIPGKLVLVALKRREPKKGMIT